MINYYYIVTEIILTFIILALAIVTHELGHFIVIKYIYKQPAGFMRKGLNIGVYSPTTQYLKPIKRIVIALSGIGLGMIPLILIGSNWVLWFAILAYLAGTSKDIAIIVKEIEKIKRGL